MICKENQIFQGSKNRKSLYDAYYKQNQEKKPVVILSHGFKGFKDSGSFPLMAKYWAENGFAFIKYNFTHNGGTIEQPIDFPDLEAFSENTYTKELEDLDSILNLIESGEIIPLDEIDLDKIYLLGHSRGGGTTLLKGIQDKRVKKIVTLASVCTMDRFGTDQNAIEQWKKEGVTYFENSRTNQNMPLKYNLYEDYITNIEKLDIQSHLKKLDKPYLNIHGEEDETVNIQEAYLMKEWQPTIELIVMPGVMHTFGSFHPWKENFVAPELKEASDIAMKFLNN